MAAADVPIDQKTFLGGKAWSARDAVADASSVQVLKTAPGAGLALYISRLVFSTVIELNLKLQEDTAGSPADLIPPIYFLTTMPGSVSLDFFPALKVSDNKNLGYIASAIGAVSVLVQGFTR